LKKNYCFSAILNTKSFSIMLCLIFLFLLCPPESTAREQVGNIKGFWHKKERVIVTQTGRPVVEPGRGDEQLAIIRMETQKQVPEDELKVGLPIMQDDRIDTREDLCLIIEVNDGKAELVLNHHTELLFSDTDSEKKDNLDSLSSNWLISSTSLEFLNPRYYPEEIVFSSAICRSRSFGYYLRKGECFLDGMVGKIFFRNGAAWSKNTQWDLQVLESTGEKPQKTILTVVEGSVMLANDKGESVEVPADHQSEMIDGRKPQKPLQVRVIPIIEWNRKFFFDKALKGK